MTLLVLGAILCALLVIARELRFLRKQRETPLLSGAKHAPEKYKAPIFTFHRSGWATRVADVDEFIGTILAVALWFKFVLPLLPAQPWIKYPTTIIGLLISVFLQSWLWNYSTHFTVDGQVRRASLSTGVRCR